MFAKYTRLWNTYGYEIIVVASIVTILLLALFRIGKKGTWSTPSSLDVSSLQDKKKKRKGAPKDSKGEIECRRVLQKLFGKSFNKDRPDFLRNTVTGGSFNLELDCYDSEMGLAVEYSGQQHYKYVPYFHKNKEAFLNQKYRDDMKRRICRDNNIILIEVPYTVAVNDIESYLTNIIRKFGFLS